MLKRASLQMRAARKQFMRAWHDVDAAYEGESLMREDFAVIGVLLTAAVVFAAYSEFLR